jgi:hypothetical protein
MSFEFKQSLGIVAIALGNGVFTYPYIKKYYRKFYSISIPAEDPTHFVSLTFTIANPV